MESLSSIIWIWTQHRQNNNNDRDWPNNNLPHLCRRIPKQTGNFVCINKQWCVNLQLFEPQGLN